MRKLMVCCMAGLLVAAVGCGNQDRRIEHTPETRVVDPPAPTPPIEDDPPQRREDPYIVKPSPPARPDVPDDQTAALMYQARLDLLRIMICSEERLTLDGESFDSDFALQTAQEHFSNLGYRVVEGYGCPGYNATGPELRTAARQKDVDLFILLNGQSSKVDRFGNFYSYEARGRGKAAQITDNELLTTQSAFVRGKRGLNEQQAAESALQAMGQELAKKISDEILRKSARGLLLRRIEVDDLPRSADADYVRVGLLDKPGIHSVDLITWDRTTRRALYWVRLEAAVKHNLAAYLENLDRITLRVERLDTTGADTHRRGLLELP